MFVGYVLNVAVGLSRTVIVVVYWLVKLLFAHCGEPLVIVNDCNVISVVLDNVPVQIVSAPGPLPLNVLTEEPCKYFRSQSIPASTLVTLMATNVDEPSQILLDPTETIVATGNSLTVIVTTEEFSELQAPLFTITLY